MTYYQRPDGKYELVRPLAWRIGGDLTLVIPAGFRFDFSIPKWLSWILDPNDPRFLKAACIHDYMLKNGWKHNRAAIEFYQGLRVMGVRKALCVLLAAAVLLWTS